jgi:hypothetical protein
MFKIDHRKTNPANLKTVMRLPVVWKEDKQNPKELHKEDRYRIRSYVLSQFIDE